VGGYVTESQSILTTLSVCTTLLLRQYEQDVAVKHDSVKISHALLWRFPFLHTVPQRQVA